MWRLLPLRDAVLHGCSLRTTSTHTLGEHHTLQISHPLFAVTATMRPYYTLSRMVAVLPLLGALRLKENARIEDHDA